MIRTIGLLAVLTSLVLISVWLADHPGIVSIEWLGYVIEPPLGIFVLMLVIFFALLYVLFRAIGWLLRTPTHWGRYQRRRKMEKGLSAANEGFLAIAASRPREAKKFADKAHKLLDQPMTLMLQAQAAQLNGEEGRAQEYFALMASEKSTAFVGTRGLLVQARKQGEEDNAYQLAQDAYALQPQDPWVVRTLVQTQMEQEDWPAAQQSLLHAARDRVLDKAERQHLLQLVLIERARGEFNNGQRRLSLEHAKRAYGLNKKFIPAVCQYALALGQQPKQALKALKLLEKSWEQQAHPAVLNTHTKIAESALNNKQVSLTAKNWQARLTALPTPANVSDAANKQLKLAKASAALAAKDNLAVHRHLAGVDRQDPAVLNLLAQVADTPQEKQLLLAEAESAETEHTAANWVCGECQGTSETWQALCPHCHGLDSLRAA